MATDKEFMFYHFINIYQKIPILNFLIKGKPKTKKKLFALNLKKGFIVALQKLKSQ